MQYDGIITSVGNGIEKNEYNIYLEKDNHKYVIRVLNLSRELHGKSKFIFIIQNQFDLTPLTEEIQTGKFKDAIEIWAKKHNYWIPSKIWIH